MQGLYSLQSLKTGSYSGYGELSTISFYFSSEVFCNPDCCLIISTWGISSKMRHSACQSSSNDCTLSKTLGAWNFRSAGRFYEMKTIIKRRSHFSSIPLSRGCSFVFRKCRIGIWSTHPEAIQTGLTTRISHTECYQPSFCQRSNLLIFRGRHSMTPII